MKINWIAVVISVVASMLIGFLFYGVLFQNQWMAGNGITADESGMKMFKNGVEMDMSATPMIYNIIAMVVYALLMTWILNKTNSLNLMGGLTMGAVIGIIQLLGIFIGNCFAYNSHSLTMVNGLYSLLLFSTIGAIIGHFNRQKN